MKANKAALVPYYHQRDSVEAFFDYCINNPGKHPIVVLPTGCLSGDTIINENRCGIGRKKRLDSMYRAFNGLNSNPRYNYDKNYKTFVRSFNGETIQLNEVESISYSGVKKLFLLKLENGLEIKATACHRFMTKDGWVRLENITVGHEVMCDTLKAKSSGSATKNGRGKRYKGDILVNNLWFHPYSSMVKTKKEKRGYTLRIEKHRAIFEAHLNNISFEEYKNILKKDECRSRELKYVAPSIYDIHHLDGDPYNNEIENLKQMTKRDHQILHSEKSKFNFNQGIPVYSKVKSVEYLGEDHTYDIGCYENHNFVANGMIVHNSGKSLSQALIVKRMLDWPDTRILLLTHQRHLIEQNYIELIENFGNDMFLDVGIYSAGLKSRDTYNRILFAGIQSVYNKAWELGFFDLILIDECHLLSHEGEGMYRTFLSEMEKINPKITIGGFTATQYRMKHGLLTEGEGAIFSDVCYEATIRELMDPDHFKNKDKKQYLCNLISKNGVNKVDLSNVHIRGGEYKSDEMQAAFQVDNLVHKAVKEIKELTADRKKILTFTAGIEHCIEVTDEMNRQGLTARCVHSKQSNEINDKNIADFKNGIFKFLNNINSMTTGFNEKAIDCIILLRSTKSAGLYYQMVGRGFRLHPSKINCLILDFGRNVETHGPVDKIEIKKKKDGSGHEVSVAPHKECPNCQSLLALAVMICPDCGYTFPAKEKHDETASNSDILSQWKRPETYDVTSTEFSLHEKIGKKPTLRVDYYADHMTKFSEWVCVEHERAEGPKGFAKRQADEWVKKRFNRIVDKIDDAIKEKDNFRITKQVIVNENDRFPKIIGQIMETQKEYDERMSEKKKREDAIKDEMLSKVMWG